MSDLREFVGRRYCVDCREILDGLGLDHADDEHDEHVEATVLRVNHVEDGQLVAVDGDMGHFSPCHFMEIDDHEQCPECGATKIPHEAVPTPPADGESP